MLRVRASRSSCARLERTAAATPIVPFVEDPMGAMCPQFGARRKSEDYARRTTRARTSKVGTGSSENLQAGKFGAWSGNAPETTKPPAIAEGFVSGPRVTRTLDPLIKSQLL